jgi:transcriptional regulator with XRE-family HTH domain
VIFAAMAANLQSRVRSAIQSGETTERAFARQAGISQPHLHNWLAGRRRLTIPMLDACAAALGISGDLLHAECGKTPVS